MNDILEFLKSISDGEGFVGGHPAITGYYITDKGQDYIKKHTSKINGKIKKIF